MATTPPKGKKGSRKRVYLALGLVALVIVGYLLYSRSKSSSASGTSPFSTGAATSPSPDTSGDSGGATGSPLADNTNGLLSALSGENQQLLNGFLATEQGLLSLAGSSVGAPTPNQQVSDNPPPLGPDVGPGIGPAQPPPAAPQSGPNGPAVLGLSDVTSTDLAPPGSPGNTTVNYLENVPAGPTLDPSSAASIAAQAAAVESTFYSSPSPAPSPTRSSPANPTGLSGNKKQGVISVH